MPPLVAPSFKERVRDHWQDPLYRNGLALVLANATTALLSGTFWILVATRATPEDAGLAAGWVAAAGVIALLGSLGLGSAFLRFLPLTAAADRKSLLDATWLWTSIATVAAGLATLAVSEGVKPEFGLVSLSSKAALVMVSLAVVISVQAESVLAAYRAGPTVLGLTALTGFARISIWFVVPELTYATVFLAWSAPMFVSAILGGFLVRRNEPGYIPFARRPARLGRPFLRYALAQHGSQTVYAAAVLGMPALIVLLAGPANGAYYYVAFSLATVLYMVPNAIGRAAIVEGSRTPDQLRRILTRSLLVSIAMGLIGGVALVILAPTLLRFFGPGYEEHAAPVLLILALVTPLVTIRAMADALLSVSQRLRALFSLNALVGILYVVLAAWLMGSGRAGIIGTAQAWASAHIVAVLFILVGAAAGRKSWWRPANETSVAVDPAG